MVDSTPTHFRSSPPPHLPSELSETDFRSNIRSVFRNSPLYHRRRHPSLWIFKEEEDEEVASPGFPLNITHSVKPSGVSFLPPHMSRVSLTSDGEPDTPKEFLPFPTLVNVATQTENHDHLSSSLQLSLDIGSSPTNVVPLLPSGPKEAKEKLAVLPLQVEDEANGGSDVTVVPTLSLSGSFVGGVDSDADSRTKEVPADVLAQPLPPARLVHQLFYSDTIDAAVQTNLPVQEATVQTDSASSLPLQHMATQTTQCPNCYFSELDVSFLCGHRNRLKVTTEQLETVCFSSFF